MGMLHVRLGCIFVSNWQLKGGHFSQKRKFCASLAISYHRRDLFIIQCTDKPYWIYPVGPRRKTTEFFPLGAIISFLVLI